MESREEIELKCRHCGEYFDPYRNLFESEDILLNEEIKEELDIRLKESICASCKNLNPASAQEESDELDDLGLALDIEFE